MCFNEIHNLRAKHNYSQWRDFTIILFAEFFYQLMDDVVIEMLALIFCTASIAMAQIMIIDVVVIIILPINVKYLCTGCVGNYSYYIQALS